VEFGECRGLRWAELIVLSLWRWTPDAMEKHPTTSDRPLPPIGAGETADLIFESAAASI